MHVVQYNLTTTTQEGGVESFVWGLAGEQARRGHRVTIVSGEGSVRRGVPGVEVRTVPFLSRHRIGVGPLRPSYALRKMAERLSMLPLALPRLRGADLVHLHKPYDLPLAALLRLRGVPAVYHGHGEDFFPGDRTLMGLAAALLSCSTYNAETLKARYRREAVVVYNGVDAEAFSPHPPDPALRARLLGRARALLLLPGRLASWKGHRSVLEALPLLEGLDARLVILGDGEARAELERRADALGLGERVLFTGTVPHAEMPRHLAAADVVIGASEAKETFGMVLAEALACEVAVVASSWRGYDDVVLDRVTGERFESGEPSSLAPALRRLLGDAALRRRYGTAGRRHVLERFTWEAVASRIEAVYAAVLAGRGAARSS